MLSTYSLAPSRRLVAARGRMKFGALTVLTCAFLSFGSSAALGQAQFEEDFDDQDKPWQEVAIQLPALPSQDDLLPFFVSATATQSFAIDPKSLTVGSDGVVRYTLVTRSAEGATNVSYEGIRCEAFERKLYAFGHANGSWSRSRRDKWERISNNAANRQHAALAKDYFCEGKSVAGDAKEILRRLRNQHSATSRFSG